MAIHEKHLGKAHLTSTIIYTRNKKNIRSSQLKKKSALFGAVPAVFRVNFFNIIFSCTSDEVMQGHVQEYEMGKRHLANIMGKDPDDFTQKDIDVSLLCCAVFFFVKGKRWQLTVDYHCKLKIEDSYISDKPAQNNQSLHRIVFSFPFVRTLLVRLFVLSSFRHRVKVFALKFIRPHILKTLWWISFIFGMIVDIGLKFLSAPSPPRGWPWGQGHRIFVKKSQRFLCLSLYSYIIKTLEEFHLYLTCWKISA